MKPSAVVLALFISGAAPWAAGAQDPVPGAASQEVQIIEDIEVRGARRFPARTVLYNLQSRPGDILNPATVQRDIRQLYTMGHFQDIRVESEEGEEGVILVFYVQEKPLIRAIDYEGLSSVTQSQILERFRERRVGLSVESPYDETRIRVARTVLRDLLAEHGRQQATVEVETYDIPPNAVGVAFVIEEGPKIKIEDIEIVGNEIFSDGDIKSAMQLQKEVGPIASFRSQDVYHRLKMADDLTRIMMFYRENGYARANVLEPEIEIRPHKVFRTLPFIKPSLPWGIPIPFWKKDVQRYYITIQVEENDQYRVGNLQVTGNEQFTDEQILAVLGLATGQVYNETLLRTGFENLSKLYGSFGYINFTPVPIPSFDDQNDIVDVTINIEEDRQFLVNRIAFRGNTTTRDKVIRREVMLTEGNIFNSQLWDLSLLRLNQLGYFEEITEQDADIRPHPALPEVDVTLNVTEKGRNTIGFSGGVSGIGGSFLGLNYETNNFLGFGETLTFNIQGGTRQSNYIFSFTEPYLLDRPITTGFSIFRSQYRFDQARDVFGLNPEDLPEGYGFENRLNFEQSRKGFNLYASYPFQVFQRFGVTYQLENSSASAVNPATSAYFDFVRQSERDNFVSTGGSFSDFKTRSIIPNYRFSTVNNPYNPSGGQSFSATFQFTGGPLGGNVNFFRPMIEYQTFRPMGLFNGIFAFRLQTSYLQGFSGTSAPFYERFFMGGDFDIRGFEFRAISPIAFVKRETQDSFTGQPIVFDDIAYIGGDTSAVANMEYRIPLVRGILTLAPFADIGNSWVTRRGQLQRQIRLPNGTTRIEGVQFVPGTNSGLRASTGVELQVQMPVINAPFRLIFAYNPLRIDQNFIGPVSGRGFFVQDDSRAIKFTVGRTF